MTSIQLVHTAIVELPAVPNGLFPIIAKSSGKNPHIAGGTSVAKCLIGGVQDDYHSTNSLSDRSHAGGR